MSRDLTPRQLDLLTQCRAAIEDFDRQHAEIVGRVVEYAQQQTGVSIVRPSPRDPAAGLPSPWWDWTPRRFLRYVDVLQRAAGTLGLDRFADRDEEFTLRDLVELTKEIELQDGMNGLYIFGEADRLAEGPTS